MAFNLVSLDTGLEKLAISYHFTLLDRCCEICCTIAYKNTSSIPINLNVEKDVEIELGSLFCLEAIVGGVIVLEQSSKYSELIANSDDDSDNKNCVDLLPDKQVVLKTKYIQELLFKDKIISLKLPYRSSNSTSNTASIDIKVDGQFSSNVKSVKCPSHPSSLSALNIEDNISNSEYQFSINGVENDNQVKEFLVDIEVQELPVLCGWTTDAISYEGTLIRSSMVAFNTSVDITNVVCKWSDQSITNIDKLPSTQSIIYHLEKQSPDTTTQPSTDNNLSISYNDQTNCSISLRKTSSSLIYRFSTFSTLKKQIEDSSSTNNSQDISFLIKLFLENNTIKSQESILSPLSFSAPDNFNCNSSSFNSNSINSSTKNLLAGFPGVQNSGLQNSGDLLSNLSNLPKIKPANLQSFTAPPSFSKDLSNPIAAFVTNRQAGSAASSGPAGLAKTKRTPPTLASISANKDGAPVDIRSQRLASYNKVNQLFGKPTRSDFARMTVTIPEMEPAAFDIALQHIKSSWWKHDRIATRSEIKKIRSIVSSVIKSDRIEITYVNPPPPAAPQKTPPPSLNGSMSDLRSLLAPKPAPPPVVAPPADAPESTEKEVDIERLKWIIEELLLQEKKSFDAEEQTEQPWFKIETAETTGQRPQMEDKHVVIEQPDYLYGINQDDNNDQVFVGIFDGHSGSIAAEYAKINLAYNIFSKHKFNSVESGHDPLVSIQHGFVDTNKAFLEIAERDERKAGTTVATAIVQREKVIISNLGDSEVILCSDGRASPLTTSHTPKNQAERERIEAAGGTIIQYGTLRVNGILSVTRAIGDRSLKDLVIADPDNHVHNVVKEDQFIVMATDGLWDVFTYQEVSDFILNDKKTNHTNDEQTQPQQDSNGLPIKLPNTADRLIEEALRRNSKDNITVSIIYLNTSNNNS